MLVRRKTQRHHGAILLNVMIFMIVISMILAGMGLMLVSDFSLGKTETNYANSLSVAEAGINYEIRKISTDALTADQKQLTGAPGVSYTTSAGTFSVYVTQRNSDGSETTPWTPGQNLWIYATGGASNLTRTVKVAASPYGTTPASTFGVFGTTSGTMNGTGTVQGNVGTNGSLLYNGNPTVTGTTTFNGSCSDWDCGRAPCGNYTCVHNANAVNWPSVESIACNAFGSTGLSYVATHNDNLLALPVISNCQVSVSGSATQTFIGKPGGSNYYLTSLNCNGNAKAIFDNTLGPINIWVGPSGGSGSCTINGGAATIKMSSDPTKAVRIYSASTGTITLNGNSEMDCGIYNVNNACSGSVVFNGTPTLYGSVICNTFTFNGNATVNATSGYFSPTVIVPYYSTAQLWQEIGGVD